MDDYKIQSLIRLGKKVEGKMRLARLTFDTNKSKRDALSNTKKLQDVEN